MPKWDFQCPACGRVREETFTSFEQQEQTTVVCSCGTNDVRVGTIMHRLPSAPRAVVIKGFNAQNGYSNGTS